MKSRLSGLDVFSRLGYVVMLHVVSLQSPILIEEYIKYGY